MEWKTIDWAALERLRHAYLSGAAGVQDYWRSPGDLESYDQTFAQRIGWKWDHALEELACRHWQPPGGELLDWGCGSGIAARAFLDHFRPDAVSALALHDRSALAQDFAARRARQKYPGLPVRFGQEIEGGTLLLSHVLSELEDAQIQNLLPLLRRATAVLWVESGDRPTSQRLVSLREQLRADFHLVAPCPHDGPCGLLTPENEPHWCHHFATPPPGVFTDGNWAHFARLAGVDLRSLPLSYLVLDRRPPAPLPPDTFRLIGFPRLYKPFARVLGCESSGAVIENEVPKRTLPEAYRLIKRGDCPSLMRWETAAGKVTRLEINLPEDA
jgi:hypothetical protein